MESDESLGYGFTQGLRISHFPALFEVPTSDMVNAILSQSCDPPNLAN